MFTSRTWVVASLCVLAGCSSSKGSASRVVRTTPSAAPAMRAHRDPVTGAWGAPPAASAPVPPAAMAAPLGSSGLVEVPTPYGGTIVDLQRRFTTHSVVNVTEHGHEVRCLDGAP